MTIVLVGAGGFLGRHLARALAAAGHAVIPVGRGDALPAGPVDVLCDCNGDSRRYFANANPGESFVANVASVAARVTAIDARLYVLMSTVDVYGRDRGCRDRNGEGARIDPAGLEVYGFHKFLAEQLVERHATRSLVLRLGTLIGRGLEKNPVFDVVHGQPIRQTPESTVSFVDLDHVGRALVALLAADATGTWNVTARRSVRIAEVLELASAILSVPPPPYHHDPIHTDYDIDISKISTVMAMPTALEMVRATLAAGI